MRNGLRLQTEVSAWNQLQSVRLLHCTGVVSLKSVSTVSVWMACVGCTDANVSDWWVIELNVGPQSSTHCNLRKQPTQRERMQKASSPIWHCMCCKYSQHILLILTGTCNTVHPCVLFVYCSKMKLKAWNRRKGRSQVLAGWRWWSSSLCTFIHLWATSWRHTQPVVVVTDSCSYLRYMHSVACSWPANQNKQGPMAALRAQNIQSW